MKLIEASSELQFRNFISVVALRTAQDVFCQALFPEKSVEFPCFHQGIFPAFGGY